MTRFFLINLVLLVGVAAKGQNIEYHFPVDVEAALYSQVCAMSKSGSDNVQICAQLNHQKDGLFSIYLFHKPSGHSYADMTKRVVVLKEYVIPLIFDFDESYCCADESKGTGTFGNRDGLILRSKTLVCRDGIVFSKEGIVTERN